MSMDNEVVRVNLLVVALVNNIVDDDRITSNE